MNLGGNNADIKQVRFLLLDLAEELAGVKPHLSPKLAAAFLETKGGRREGRADILKEKIFCLCLHLEKKALPLSKEKIQSTAVMSEHLSEVSVCRECS